MINCPHCNAPNPHGARFCGECGKSLVVEQAAPDFSTMRTVDPSLEPDAQPSREEHLPKPGDVFASRYAIAEEIGRGGMGVVYRATDNVTQREVALKLIRPDRLAGKDAVQRLIREGALARDIRHPNVVAVYDVNAVDGQPYLAMELLHGQSLRAWNQQRLREGSDCTLQIAASIVREICAGLGAAHKAGVIHRDLKPENIILLNDPREGAPELKIVDFGIARAAGGMDTGSTSIGTLEYMAPEQMTSPDAVQPSADIFSLSVMFYELLVGVVPKGHWQPPSEGRTDTPPAIDKLVERGLSNNPRARPASASDFETELVSALSGVAPDPEPGPKPGPRPRPTPPPDPGPKPAPIWANRKLMYGVAGALGVIAVGTGIAQILSGMSGGGSSGPEREFVERDDDDYVPEREPNYVPPSPPAPPPPPPPPPPPQGVNYAAMSGYWADNGLNTWSLAVSRSGEVSGGATQGPMMGASLAGQFNGTRLDFQLYNAFGVLGTGRGAFDGGCHISINVQDVTGGTGSDMFHVNHPPGAPCP